MWRTANPRTDFNWYRIRSLAISLFMALALIGPLVVAPAVSAQEIVWTRQFGTLYSEAIYGTSVDSSGVYVAGYTAGTLQGETSLGGDDAFVRKYDHDGTEMWTRQFGTSGSDCAWAVTVDSSGVYVAGVTSGTLPGQTSLGDKDAFVRKYDHDGSEVWIRQFGTSGDDGALDVSVDSSGVYITGWTSGTLPGQTSLGGNDAFVRKYDHDGTEMWTRQFGTSVYVGTSGSECARAGSVDSSGVYVAGYTTGTLPGQTRPPGWNSDSDTFVRKYDHDGTEVWTRQFGTYSDELPRTVSVDSSGVYVAGHIDGAFPFPGQTSLGGDDAFVRKYDHDGTEMWTHQFGTSGRDYAYEVSMDSSGVYVAGHTTGALPGQTSLGGDDAFVRKYHHDGSEVWIRQFGTSGDDFARAVSVDSSGVYVSGDIIGTFPGQTNLGGRDAFVVMISHPGITPPGQNVVVQLEDCPEGTVGGTPVTITFDAVTVGGNTTLCTSSQGQASPSGFAYNCAGRIYYEINTTATYLGNIEVCIDYAEDCPNESNMKLFHKKEGQPWQDVTSSLDTQNNIICGIVDSFSVFAIFAPVDDSPSVGGIAEPIDKMGLLVPWMTFVTLILLTVGLVVFRRVRK
jgi:hypothetical protein